jgi:hybrid cluster-associated redox disulfide protein
MAEKKSAKPAKSKAIARDMMLGDLVQDHPEAAMLMAKRGMHCVGCGMAAWETIEQGARAHGMSEEDIDKLIEEMNKLAGKKPGKK